MISDFLDAEFVHNCHAALKSRNVGSSEQFLRWDQSVSFVNIHIKGIYDNLINHTDSLSKNPKVKSLAELAQLTFGDLYNICFYEDVNPLVDHLMGVHSRPKVTLQFANISTNGKNVVFDSQNLVADHFVLLPTDKLDGNQFVWDKPETVKIPKFPSKCLDNYSIVNFPEEAYYISGEVLTKSSSVFCDVDFPSVPRYFVDPSHMLIKKCEMTIKGDAYTLESPSLLAKFKALFEANPKLKKVLVPVYYYFLYEQNYHMIGYIKYEVSGKNDEFCKMEFKHYPLKFLQLNDIVTNHKPSLGKMMEKIIESLPRYSHNYYFSILKMHNITSLLKKRFKFKFCFSVDTTHQNKVAARNLVEDYEKHMKRVNEVIAKKAAILEAVASV